MKRTKINLADRELLELIKLMKKEFPMCYKFKIFTRPVKCTQGKE